MKCSLIELMIDNRMDGLILVAPRMAGPTLEAFARQIPVVAVAHHEPSRSFDTINTDDRLGGRRATEALIAAGHRDIAMVSYEADRDHTTNVSYEREIGYGQAMATARSGARSPHPALWRPRKRPAGVSSRVPGHARPSARNFRLVRP